MNGGERKMNGKVIYLQREEVGGLNNPRASRILDRLSKDVSEACDRFFEQRKMRRSFSDLWRGLKYGTKML